MTAWQALEPGAWEGKMSANLRDALSANVVHVEIEGLQI